MMDLQYIESRLRERFPGVVVEREGGADPNQPGWLDARLDGHWLALEWRPGGGFGLSTGTDTERPVFGEGHDEVYFTAEQAAERASELLANRRRSRPPQVVVLRRLREIRHLSQAELALKLGVSQASISKAERRDDMLLSTLQGFIEAMGGSLELWARFPDGSVRLEELGR